MLTNSISLSEYIFVRPPNFSSPDIKMVPINKKRRLADRNCKPVKRPKSDYKDAASVQSGAKKTVNSLDALPWTQVPIPDRFEDAEGFFGLEEIEDVEVVKNEKLGKLEYRVGKGSCD